MYFYELHEGDDELYSDVILVREDEMTPEDFFDVVESIRRRIKDGYEDATLIESIAVQLERDYGFIYVSDDRIAAAVNVSTEDEENFLISADDEFEGADYRGLVIEGIDADEGSRPN